MNDCVAEHHLFSLNLLLSSLSLLIVKYSFSMSCFFHFPFSVDGIPSALGLFHPQHIFFLALIFFSCQLSYKSVPLSMLCLATNTVSTSPSSSHSARYYNNSLKPFLRGQTRSFACLLSDPFFAFSCSTLFHREQPPLASR